MKAGLSHSPAGCLAGPPGDPPAALRVVLVEHQIPVPLQSQAEHQIRGGQHVVDLERLAADERAPAVGILGHAVRADRAAPHRSAQDGVRVVGVAQVGASQVGTVELCPGEVGPGEVGSGQGGVGQIRPTQIDTAEVGIDKDRPAQIQSGESVASEVLSGEICPSQGRGHQAHRIGERGSGQDRAREIRPSQICHGEVGGAQIRRSQCRAIEVSTQKVGSGEVRRSQSSIAQIGTA